VNLQSDSFVLVVRHSKTNQFGPELHQIPYTFCSDIRLCPVHVKLMHLTTSKLLADSSLFSGVALPP
jgi:hypothetical protein